MPVLILWLSERLTWRMLFRVIQCLMILEEPPSPLAPSSLPWNIVLLKMYMWPVIHFSLPAYPVTEVIDPTGAGDCFAGGFMGYCAQAGNTEPETLKRAMLHGTVAASYCVQGFSVEDIGKRGMGDYQERYNDLMSIVTI